ncbi:MAG: hypothetical protein ABJ007_10155 [Pseudophaeobacter sp.]|uniref:dTMP kinase n=1 Tax=Pseudophaeobacter sp. TaxID=1971739 RepID=UPI00329A3626
MFFNSDTAPDAPFAIAFVGNDGTGKSTMSKAVQKRLAPDSRVRRVDKWDVLRDDIYPEYAFMGDDLPQLRRCTSNMQETTRTLFLFWTLHGTLKPEVVEGADFILLDGYWPKHAASEMRYSGQSGLVREAVKLMPQANLTFYLDLDPAESWRRRTADPDIPLVPYECGLDPSLSEAAFMEHQTAVRNQLVEWSDSYGWHRIDAARTQDEICQQVLEIVDQAVGKKMHVAV